MNITRRQVLQGGVGSILLASVSARSLAEDVKPELKGEIGVTTGSFMRHLSQRPAKGKLRLLDLPQLMEDELDMRVIDLMTRTLASMEPDYLEDFRARAEKAGCTITNLKMNQPGLDMASPDEAARKQALDEYKRTIDAAKLLGCRWVRPLPTAKRPELKLLAVSYRELIDYAGPKGIGLLIENFGWISEDVGAIPEMVKLVGPELLVAPDTGNWTDRNRYEGLAQVFSLAVTCDFKAFPFNEAWEHPRYDLHKCFQIGWESGFRGPWCLEHFSDSYERLLEGMIRLRGMLEQWMKEAA